MFCINILKKPVNIGVFRVAELLVRPVEYYISIFKHNEPGVDQTHPVSFGKDHPAAAA